MGHYYYSTIVVCQSVTAITKRLVFFWDNQDVCNSLMKHHSWKPTVMIVVYFIALDTRKFSSNKIAVADFSEKKGQKEWSIVLQYHP